MDDMPAQGVTETSSFYDLVGFRKVTYISFLLNHGIGSLRPANFRNVNIRIHCMNSVQAYLLHTERHACTAKVLSERHRKVLQRPFTPLVSAALYVLFAPIKMNAVAFIIQRMTVLSKLFVLLSMLLYASACRGPARRHRG